MLTTISFLVLGVHRAIVVTNFYFKVSNIKQWNVMIDATSYIAITSSIFYIKPSRMPAAVAAG
jgi:hypothetical protein